MRKLFFFLLCPLISLSQKVQLLWHWAMTRPDVARDIEIARKATPMDK